MTRETLTQLSLRLKHILLINGSSGTASERTLGTSMVLVLGASGVDVVRQKNLIMTSILSIKIVLPEEERPDPRRDRGLAEGHENPGPNGATEAEANQVQGREMATEAVLSRGRSIGRVEHFAPRHRSKKGRGGGAERTGRG